MKIIATSFFFLISCCFYGQKNDLEILKADSTWGKEIIVFPIAWAPEMNVVGFEELRFAPDWQNPDSEEFWSLVMAWKINTSETLSKEKLEENLIAYFDGLMKPNHWSQEFPEPSLLLSKVINRDKKETYSGILTLFDGFHTGKVIILNVKITSQFCILKNAYYVMIRFSPAPKTAPIWTKLNDITFLNPICN